MTEQESDSATVDATDEVDPELLKLPRRRRGRHPVVALAVILLSAYLMYFVRDDFCYFFSARTPVNLGEVTEALKSPELKPGRYVTIQGAPDRKRALLLRGRISGYDAFFQLLQSRGRMFVQRHRRQRSSDRVVPTLHTGRLVRFDSLPYRRSVREALEKAASVAHDLDFEVVAKAKRDGATALRDQRGRTVEVRPATRFWINASYPNEWLIQFSKKAYATAKHAEQQLSGIKLPYALEAGNSPSFWRFVVLASDDEVVHLIRQFGDPKLAAGVVRRQVSYVARWREMRIEDGELVLADDDPTPSVRYRLQQPTRPAERAHLIAEAPRPVRIPRQSVLYISTSSEFKVPDDALVLIAGERPGDYWYYALLYLLLGGFIAINAFAIGSRWRQRT